MEPNNQPNSAPEEAATNVSMDSVPDAIEPDTSSTQMTPPSSVDTPMNDTVAPTAQSSPGIVPSSTPFPSDNNVVASTTVSSQSNTATPKKNTRLILIIVLVVLVVAAAGVMIYVATMG